MVQSRAVTDNFWISIKSYPSLCVSISTYFLYFRQFPKLSLNKSRDLSRILCLFITTAIFIGSECFLVGTKCRKHRYSYRIDIYFIPECVSGYIGQQWSKKVDYGSIIGRKNGWIIDHQNWGDSTHYPKVGEWVIWEKLDIPNTFTDNSHLLILSRRVISYGSGTSPCKALPKVDERVIW